MNSIAAALSLVSLLISHIVPNVDCSVRILDPGHALLCFGVRDGE